MMLDEAFSDQSKRAHYEATLDLLWLEVIVDSNECIKDARVLLEAPHWLLTPGPSTVLDRMARTLFERAALRIINVLTDDAKGALTLESLRCLLLETCDDVRRASLERLIRDSFEMHSFEHLRKKAIRLRHKGLAHVDAKHTMNPELRAAILLTVGELEELLGKAKGLISALSLGVEKSFDLLTPSPEHDMGYVVGQLMRDSVWLRTPEDQGPIVLKAFAAEWTEQQRRTFNRWRTQSGMPEIDFTTILP